MNDGYFNIKRDNQIVAAGGFFCLSCLVGRTIEEISPDPWYCKGCFEYLSEEATLLSPSRGKQAWVPVPAKATKPQDKREVVLQQPHNGIIPRATTEEVLHHGGGRPRKEGEVHRTTRWRREREKQLVLI